MSKFPYQNGGKVKVITKTVELASQAAATEIVIGTVPENAVIKDIKMHSSATLGSTTVKIGTSADDDKYRAAATFTTANSATSVCLAAVANTPLSAEEELVATTATAALPASGTLHFVVEYVID